LHNDTGNANTASGANALVDNILGNYNTASGVYALLSNTTGSGNTASGVAALVSNISGGNNIGLGVDGGSLLTTGSNNIDIGNKGVAAEANTIRIGTKEMQTATYIAGISGVGVSGAPVEVSSAGKLGVVISSARFKHDIHDMGDKSSALLKLRPVSFRYNSDPANTLQYGLVAEEVAKVYPELVVYGPDGKVMTVRYSMLSAMLLNELQKQNSELRNQTATNQRQAEQLARQADQIKKMTEVETSTRRALDAQRAAFEQRLSRLEQPTQAKDGNHNLVAAFNK